MMESGIENESGRQSFNSYNNHFDNAGKYYVTTPDWDLDILLRAVHFDCPGSTWRYPGTVGTWIALF
jgi:hypothetical protein